MLQDALRRTAGIEHLPFSWRTALFGRYDVFHVHWGDTLLAAGSRRTRAGKRVAMAVLLGRLALTRTPVVRTVHNVTPPEGGRRRWLSTGGSDDGAEAAPAPRVKLGGTLFERMQNASRGAQRSEDEAGDKDSLDIPRFLHRQSNQ